MNSMIERGPLRNEEVDDWGDIAEKLNKAPGDYELAFAYARHCGGMRRPQVFDTLSSDAKETLSIALYEVNASFCIQDIQGGGPSSDTQRDRLRAILKYLVTSNHPHASEVVDRIIGRIETDIPGDLRRVIPPQIADRNPKAQEEHVGGDVISEAGVIQWGTSSPEAIETAISIMSDPQLRLALEAGFNASQDIPTNFIEDVRFSFELRERIISARRDFLEARAKASQQPQAVAKVLSQRLRGGNNPVFLQGYWNKVDAGVLPDMTKREHAHLLDPRALNILVASRQKGEPAQSMRVSEIQEPEREYIPKNLVQEPIRSEQEISKRVTLAVERIGDSEYSDPEVVQIAETILRDGTIPFMGINMKTHGSDVDYGTLELWRNQALSGQKIEKECVAPAAQYLKSNKLPFIMPDNSQKGKMNIVPIGGKDAKWVLCSCNIDTTGVVDGFGRDAPFGQLFFPMHISNSALEELRGERPQKSPQTFLRGVLLAGIALNPEIDAKKLLHDHPYCSVPREETQINDFQRFSRRIFPHSDRVDYKDSLDGEKDSFRRGLQRDYGVLEKQEISGTRLPLMSDPRILDDPLQERYREKN